MWHFFTRFLLSKASGWLAVLFLSIIGGLGWYIKNLQLEAARCEGQEEIRAQLEELTGRVIKDVEEDTDDKIRNVRRDPEDCLDSNLPESVLNGLRND
jgi:hypothetical protein